MLDTDVAKAWIIIGFIAVGTALWTTAILTWMDVL